MADKYMKETMTPAGLRKFKASAVTDELRAQLKDVFMVEYGVTSYADVLAAYNAGKNIVLKKTGRSLQDEEMDDLYMLVDYLEDNYFNFSRTAGYICRSVKLTPGDVYTTSQTVLTPRTEVMDTLSAEIAPDYSTLIQEYTSDDKFPIPAGTHVTYLDNTGSTVLQYLYRSKVAISRDDAISGADPINHPEKWDKVTVAGSVGRVVYITPFATPYDEIQAAYDAGKTILANMNGPIYALSNYDSYQQIFSFSRIAGYTWIQFRCCKDQYPSTNDWDPNPVIVDIAEHSQIAPEYSNTSTYAVGNLVYNGGTLYRCTTAISIPEAWNSAHWTATTVEDELELKANEAIYENDYSSNSFSHITFDMLNDASNKRRDITLIKSGSPYGRVTNVYRLDSTGGGHMGQPYTWTFKAMDGSGYNATQDSNETTGLRWEALS